MLVNHRSCCEIHSCLSFSFLLKYLLVTGLRSAVIGSSSKLWPMGLVSYWLRKVSSSHLSSGKTHTHAEPVCAYIRKVCQVSSAVFWMWSNLSSPPGFFVSLQPESQVWEVFVCLCICCLSTYTVCVCVCLYWNVSPLKCVFMKTDSLSLCVLVASSETWRCEEWSGRSAHSGLTQSHISFSLSLVI